MNRKKWITLGMGIIGIALLIYVIQDRFISMTWNAWNLPLSGRIIYIDPGHGGPDGGADNGDAVEKDIALEISKKLRDYLQEQGALVLMTRSKDTDLADEDTRGLSRRKVEDLHRRVDLINESEADLFISIHLNSIPSSRWHGAQTFYGTRYVESKIAAELIQEELVDKLENTDRVAKSINNVYLMKSTKKPGVLVEVGFLSNPTERDLLMQEGYQDKIAASIYEGVSRYFTNELDEKQKLEEQEDDDEN
ncbi:N-acetylmuramoyl-L-alanine amidase CwlD [Caldibacillus lycopersici]|uniref:N-acetylmuramoyl-L-alanine amidase CwlD n=1 Tax=Perspicuibacillus lycopersici TaxID=1325689 RepID=A0AAE3IVA4_9BACI|nr:N-acetylmuramoyl-L-alanine amidase CwlD [Perspicuibacillus lycopersici]MCU9615181.1 N-acetylmuramoyl-L-alanine amidase CwlD [Perspicuibacillus lycopersici]